MQSWFDDMDPTAINKPKKPIWTLNLDTTDNDKDILNWLNGELEYLKSENQNRYWRVTRNIALYKGIQYQQQETREEVRDRNEQRNRALQKVVVNQIYDLTQQRVSRLIKYRPAVSILPTNDEMEDKVAAKMCKYLLDHIQYEQEFDDKVVPEFVRNTFIAGEAFIFITWDPDAGDIHPDWRAAQERGEDKVPMIDKNGKPMLDQNGNERFIESPIKTGDVKYTVKLPVDVYYQITPKLEQNWENTDYCFVREIMYTDEARQKYPDVAYKIQSEQQPLFYDYDRMTLQRQDDYTVVWHFYHRYHPCLPKGREIVFTKDTICKNTELPYSHGQLPAVRMTDIDVPGQMPGMSFIDNIKQLNGAYNNLTNMMMRNAILVSHPKWMMPNGAANIEQLGNDITIVQYKGPTPPQLVTTNTITGDLFQLREQFKQDIQIISGVSGVARNEPPAGVKSGVALQFLSEQDQERANESVMKYNGAMKEVAQMTLSVAGDYYDRDDGRLIRVIGKNNQWMTEFFDAQHLYKDYDVRIQNSSALPQSRAARTQTLLDLNQQFPDQVTPERVLDLLDLAQNEKFTDLATASVRAAEGENEMVFDGKDVLEPEEYEHHIQHWKVHTAATQSYSFKYETKLEIQDALKDHIMVHEMLMMDKASKNPKFAEELKALDMFPMFFTQRPDLSPPPPLVEQIPPGMPMGAYPDEQQMPVTEPGIPPMETQLEVPPPPSAEPIPPTTAV